MYQIPNSTSLNSFSAPFNPYNQLQSHQNSNFGEEDGLQKTETRNSNYESSDLDFDIYNPKKSPTNENQLNGNREENKQQQESLDVKNIKKEPIDDKNKAALLKNEEASQGGFLGAIKGIFGGSGNKGPMEAKKPKKAVLPADKKKTVKK